MKITREDGKYVLLFSDGGYATKSWKEMITSGVSLDKELGKLIDDASQMVKLQGEENR